MEHTKGPWYIDNEYNDYEDGIYMGGMHVKDDNDGYIICEMWPIKNEFEANARLIASAPEMLSVLKNVSATLHILDEHYKRTENNTTKMVDDIIAKAEGRE